MSRRDQIKMTDDDVAAFLAEEKVVVVATNGRDGYPHQMPLWYVVRDSGLVAWTYAKSQKIKNLERDPRATLTIEKGVEYQELHGVMLKCDVTLITDTEQVAEVGIEIFKKYSGGAGSQLADQVREMVVRQAVKRVAMRFTEVERATWDHRKLAAGVY
jgi:PPOX class probable F420-dependent enzyme